jgi:hypothetical protein
MAWGIASEINLKKKIDKPTSWDSVAAHMSQWAHVKALQLRKVMESGRCQAVFPSHWCATHNIKIHRTKKSFTLGKVRNTSFNQC